MFFPLFGTGGLWEPSGAYCVIYHRDNNTVIHFKLLFNVFSGKLSVAVLGVNHLKGDKRYWHLCRLVDSN